MELHEVSQSCGLPRPRRDIDPVECLASVVPLVPMTTDTSICHYITSPRIGFDVLSLHAKLTIAGFVVLVFETRSLRNVSAHRGSFHAPSVGLSGHRQ